MEVAQLDLADLSSVARFEGRLAKEPRLDALICNAGVMMCPFSHTKDGFEMQIGTNHFGASPSQFTLVDASTSRVLPMWPTPVMRDLNMRCYSLVTGSSHCCQPFDFAFHMR